MRVSKIKMTSEQAVRFAMNQSVGYSYKAVFLSQQILIGSNNLYYGHIPVEIL